MNPTEQKTTVSEAVRNHQEFLFPTVIAFLIAILCCLPIFGQTEEKRIQRLSDLAKVWGAVKYFHPFPAYKEIDLDKALVEAIPKVNAAKSPEEYAQALNSMLAALGDDSTRAFAGAEKSPTQNKANSKEPLRLENGVLYYDALEAGRLIWRSEEKSHEFNKNFFKFLPQAKALVIDARIEGESDNNLLYSVMMQMREIFSSLLDRKITLGSLRYRIHSFYAPQSDYIPGRHSWGMMTSAPQTFGEDREKTVKTPPPVVIVDVNSPLAEMFSGLQTAGRAFIVAESNNLGADLHTIKLADGVEVKMRVTEIANPDGTVPFTPDAVAPKGEAFQTAQKIVAENKFVSDRIKHSAANLGQVSQKDKPYAAMEFPDKNYRLLALFRFWNVINYFFPYKDLTDADWNEILPKYIPKFEANADAYEYQITVRELAAETHDSHVVVGRIAALNDKFGRFAPPVVVRFVENQTVVVKVFDDNLPIKTGDVILSVDGEDIGKRRDFFARITASSTPLALMRNVHNEVLRGQKDSIAKLTVRGMDKKNRTIEIARSMPRGDRRWADANIRTTPVYQILPSGFAYVDLDRLTDAEVDKMFETIKVAPAVIFDMRGYPNVDAGGTIAPRLSDKTSPVAALWSSPIVEAIGLRYQNNISGTPQNTFAQPLPPREGKEIYHGKIVMLINEYAQSWSEQVALFFEAARPDITFIGTPTSGAMGNITNMVLPGNLIVSFTGHNVRHADGRQLQRVGIQPTIKVVPTIKGIVAGKDEILDAAIKFLQKSK
jgi:C-terminal processing protease CtpA/Prc